MEQGVKKFATVINDNPYETTSKVLEELKDSFPYYKEIVQAFKEGFSTVELRKRYMIRAIDEAWVNIIEDTIPSLETIIRAPQGNLTEEEEVVPVEKTKKVTPKAITHLIQHSHYINTIEPNGFVRPAKLLNVYQDDTYLSYEHKFINTLLNRVYAFVISRYNKAIDQGEDEKNTQLNITQNFEHNFARGKINLSIEVSEKPQKGEVVKNYVYDSELWKRIEKIRRHLDSFMATPFIKSMGKNFIRPPVMRTNKLLKNVDFRKCLALWEFISSYTNSGYETLVQESLEKVEEDCLVDIYNTMSEQYTIFNKFVNDDFSLENELDFRETEVFNPDYKDELDPFDINEYNIEQKVADGVNDNPDQEYSDRIELALRVALRADDMYVISRPPVTEVIAPTSEDGITYKYRYSFLARLIFSQNPTQDYYSIIKNKILSNKGATSSISWRHELFRRKKDKICLINIKGKTVCLYLPLNPAEFMESKYNFINQSSVKMFKDTPFLYKVKNPKSLEYALELLDIVFKRLGLEENPSFEPRDYHYDNATPEELLQLDPPLVRLVNEKGEVIHSVDKKVVEEDEVPEEVIESEEITYTTDDGKDGTFNAFATEEIVKEDSEETPIVKEVEAKEFKVEEPKVEETKIVEETKVEEVTTEEPVIEETPVEEVEVKTEEPVIEETESKEEVSETKTIEITKEEEVTIEKEEIVEEPVASEEVVTEEVEVSKPVEVVTEEVSETPENIDFKYRYSFYARFIMSQEPTQTYYSTIKNALMSYEGVKNNISWRRELFRRVNDKLAYVNIKGKTIDLFLALDPNDYIDTKIKFTDQSKNKIYKDTPFLFKIRNPKNVRQALELIEKVAERFNLVKDPNYQEVEYKEKLATIEELLERKLIRPIEDNESSGLNTSKEVTEEVTKEVVTKEVVKENITKEISETSEETKVVKETVVIEKPVEIEVKVKPKEEVEEIVNTTDSYTEGYNPVVKETPIIKETPVIKPIINNEGVNLPGVLTPVKEKTVNFVYRYSYMARLIQAEKDTQDLYGEIKNHILSYEGVKFNISWRHEMFRISKNKIAQLKIRGKVLYLYMVCDPELIDLEKYNFVLFKVNNPKEYTCYLKVRNTRFMTRVKEFLDLWLESYNLEKGDNPKVSYRYEYKSNDELLSMDPPLITFVEGDGSDNEGDE